MKLGKISESVLKRSILKQIKHKNGKVINGAGVGSDCAVFSCPENNMLSSVQSDTLNNPSEIRYLIHKTVNNVATAVGKPFAMMLTITFPAEAEESELQEIMKYADTTAAELDIQIAGGHTQISEAITKPVVSVTVLAGKENTDEPVKAKAQKLTSMAVVMTKWIGLEGSTRLARDYEKELRTRFPQNLLEEAQNFDRYLSVLPEAATAAKSNVNVMHDVSGGGIFAALWELADNAGVGLNIDLKKIPVKQETIEICEFFGLNPYELLSGGSLLMLAEDGENLVQELNNVHISAKVIGFTTADNDKIIINEDEKRYLERPKTDSYNMIKEAYQ